ncbi:MAG: hypothetical protein E7546_00035 [Ruminococcaceae bacterium]|nr:hypothetical protein [Oscillospiraceae bacterium]
MKKFRSVVAMLLAVLMVAALFAACGNEPAAPATEDTGMVNTGDTFTVYVWNEEFKGFFENYYWTEDKAAEFDNIAVEFVVNTDQGGVYQTKLDNALANGEAVDLFLAEADYITKYVQSAYTMDVADLGITADDLAGCYAYTLEIGTDAKGAVKAVSWQACPGAMTYRTDWTEEYFGIAETRDAAQDEAVQALVSDWDKYIETASAFAAKDKELGNGYYFVAGLGDVWYAYKAGRTAAWVDAEYNLGLNDYITGYFDIAKAIQESGAIPANGGYGQWGTEWAAGYETTGDVFSYLSCTWHIPFCMNTGLSTETFWRAITGPVGFFWGGTWMLASVYCDNMDLAKDVMYTWSCDADFLTDWAVDSGNFANQQAKMEELAADDSITMDFLCGQNFYAVFAEPAAKVEMKYLSKFDRDVEDLYKAVAQDYATGKYESKDAAVEAFKTELSATLPVVNVG